MLDRKDGIAILVITLLVLAAFWQATLGGVFYSFDISQVHYPLRSVYAAELARSALPLWTPLLFAGYPLLAEGQLGALYPPNLILYRLLPVPVALSVFIVGHLVWAAVGVYVFARRLRMQRLAASCVALGVGLGGFAVAHRGQVNIVAAAAWLPWLLLLANRLLAGADHAHPGRDAALLALALGMAFLTDQLQMALLSLLAVAAYGLYLFLTLRLQARVLLLLVTSLLAGAALAAAQLLPMYELARLSVRSRGVDLGLLTSSDPAVPRQELTTPPRSLPLLQSELGVYRIYTQQAASSLSALRESYFPDLSLQYGVSTANGLASLVPARYAQYTAAMTPQMLNLLGVKYYLIPQALRVGEASGAYDLDDPFLFNPLDRKAVPTPLVMAAAVEIEWYLSESADWENGKHVAALTFLAEETVDIMEFALAVGSHVADWAYERSDVKAGVRHDQAAIARTFPARSGSPPEDHPGYVYRTVIQLPYAVFIQGLRLLSSAPPAQIHIERVTLIDEQGQHYLLSHLEGKSDHTLAYRSEDVAIFENHDVLPRVFLTYQARAVPDDTATLAILRSAEFDPRREVLLAAEQIASTRPPTAGTERVELAVYDSRQVVVQVRAPAAGYLVLTDAWYPGWRVRVDGEGAPLLRADLVFRAVHLQAGEHTVEFTYDPASFRTGLAISAAGLLLVLGLGLWGGKKTGLREKPDP
jgi:hypothetical protein